VEKYCGGRQTTPHCVMLRGKDALCLPDN